MKEEAPTLRRQAGKFRKKTKHKEMTCRVIYWVYQPREQNEIRKETLCNGTDPILLLEASCCYCCCRCCVGYVGRQVITAAHRHGIRCV